MWKGRVLWPLVGGTAVGLGALVALNPGAVALGRVFLVFSLFSAAIFVPWSLVMALPAWTSRRTHPSLVWPILACIAEVLVAALLLFVSGLVGGFGVPDSWSYTIATVATSRGVLAAKILLAGACFALWRLRVLTARRTGGKSTLQS